MTEEVLEGEVVGGEVSEELVRQPGASTLFHTTDPTVVVARAQEVASTLTDILKQQGLTTKISGKDHVQVEGWQLVGSMLGVFPVEAWTRPVPLPEGQSVHPKGEWGYESRYEARTREGDVVGAGVARCTRSEGTWKGRDDYALLSMAQTRATSKALKAPLGWIVALAGYNSTPSEEMPVAGPAAASPELEDSLVRAVGLLLGDTEAVMPVIIKLAQDGDGTLTRLSARAVVHVAAAYKKLNPQEVVGGDGNDERDSQQPDVREGSG